MWKGIGSFTIILLAAQLVHAQTANRAWPYWGGRPSVNYGYPNYGNAYPAYGNNYANYPGYSGNSNGYPALWYPSVPELTRMPQGPPATNQGTDAPRSSAAAAPMTELITPPADRAGEPNLPVTGPPSAVLGDGYPAEPPAPEAHFPAEKTTPRLWGGVDYLLWWIRDGPVPFPLVTTGDAGAPVPGALGQLGTQTLFGSNDADFGGLSGFRGTLGLWIDRDARWGVEASGFLLEEGSVHFAAGSDVNGNPPLFVPVFRTDLSREGTFIISSPPLAGNINIDYVSRLWGIEGNLYCNLCRNECVDVDLLVGARYLDLQEKLELSGTLTTSGGDITDVFDESFRTRNQFVGGQIGARIGRQYGPLFAVVTPKVALGSTHQVVDINGSITESGTGILPHTFPGAILTQPTNIGHQARDEFSVVPQVSLTVGWQICPWARVYAGYDFLYWNRVVRPGDQIDRNVNATQSVFEGAALVGPATPTPRFNSTEFYVQGVSAGVQFRY